MGRLIGAVLLGYIVLAIAVPSGLSSAYLALGADRAFRPGVYEVSMLWVVISLVAGFAAALLGGWVARRVARSVTGPRVLAGFVAALGIAIALLALIGEPASSTARTDAVGPMEAMQHAQTPLWIMFLNPLIGALGVLIGGGALRTRRVDTVDDAVVMRPPVH